MKMDFGWSYYDDCAVDGTEPLQAETSELIAIFVTMIRRIQQGGE